MVTKCGTGTRPGYAPARQARLSSLWPCPQWTAGPGEPWLPHLRTGCFRPIVHSGLCCGLSVTRFVTQLCSDRSSETGGCPCPTNQDPLPTSSLLHCRRTPGSSPAPETVEALHAAQSPPGKWPGAATGAPGSPCSLCPPDDPGEHDRKRQQLPEEATEGASPAQSPGLSVFWDKQSWALGDVVQKLPSSSSSSSFPPRKGAQALLRSLSVLGGAAQAQEAPATLSLPAPLLISPGGF